MKRKALALLLFSIMIFSMIPITANAATIASGVCGDKATWKLDSDGTLTISGTGKMYDMYPVSSNNPWFEYYNKITSITIKNGITEIGIHAFSGLSNVTKVTIPNSVTVIDKYAFSSCKSLTSIEIPNSVATIGGHAFRWCYNLVSITIPDSVTVIGEWTFESCTKLTNITIPASVTYIDEYAFADCTSLTSVVIPDSVNAIGAWAFYGCTSLTSITIPKSITKVGKSTFGGCSNLTSVTIPDDVTYIDEYAFFGCTKLKNVYYEGSVDDWKRMSIIDTYNDYLINATIHYNISYLDTPSPDDNYHADNTVPPACSLSELTTADFLAFSHLAYSDFKNVFEIASVKSFLGDKWDKTWSGDIKYSDLCEHIAGWEPFDVYENTSNGFYSVAFRNSKNEVVIAYRGSENPMNIPSDPDAYNDWLRNDFPMILGNIIGSQLNDAIEAYNDISSVYGKSKIVTTGHSLGGALGDIVSAYSGCKGITFNAVPALDAAYRDAVNLMAPTFAGIDKWNFIDQANENDFFAGAFEKFFSTRIKPYVAYQGNGKFVHGLESLVHKDSNGNVVMNKQTGSFKPTSTISNYMTLAYKSIDLGISSNEIINKGLTILASRTSYGGDGFDVITTGILADTLVGGKHDDELDGGYGDDTYIYFKGDGKDIIIDVAGKDKLYLYGFGKNDKLEIVDDEVAGYIYVICNGNVIVEIKNDNRNQWTNSFEIYIEQNNKITEHDITEYFSSKNFGAHVLIACPVEIQILDANGTVVYTVKDGEVGNYYTDFGNFYVYEEEDGGNGKVLDLVEGYTFNIVGVGTGTMDISYQRVEENGLSEVQTMTDIPVSDSYTATLEENTDGVFELKQLSEGDEIPDDDEISSTPDNSTTVSDVIEDTSKNVDKPSSGYVWIIVCVVGVMAIAGIIAYLIIKKKRA